MRLAYEEGEFTQKLNHIKQEIFGTPEIVLHRKEILGGKPPFEILAADGMRERFDEMFLGLLGSSTYRVFTVVLDKKEHSQKYARWRFDAYHYCLTVALERYVMLLNRLQQQGDVMAESRGEKDNRRLERAYKYIYQNGSAMVEAKEFQQRLSSKEIKIKRKVANIAGLQMADLLSNPSSRHLICEKTGVPMTADFGKAVVGVLRKNKYLKSPTGKIEGWGTKWLP